ncbi:MAG: cation-translocating P-type ATPase [Ktedonobacteraceae bacterium]|nr:cation-translocating P-type ATPase [Ktedonobacteraceae bacterium]
MATLSAQQRQGSESIPVDITKIRGLSASEVRERLQQDGYNELPSARKRSLLTIALDIVREPMFLLLLAGGAVYLLLGDIREALVLLGSIFVIMGITFYQEQKTERALDALRDLSSPRALVIRDGEQQRIAGREVVCGDIVVLAEGDRVPADAVLLWSINLSADESLLTGESVPVRKRAAHTEVEARKMGAAGGDDLPFVFSGTLVTQGQGFARVLATGIDTELGKIGKALQTVTTEKTRLQQSTGRLVRLLAVSSLLLCTLVVVLYGLLRGDWLNGVLAGITLAMSLLPEEFPVVLTIFLALGAWRIAKQQVLTRRMPAIETLGATTVLCVDKTGTLTENRMAVQQLFADGASFNLEEHEREQGSLPERFHDLVELAVLASQRDPFDPMERALHRAGKLFLSDAEYKHSNWTLMREYPLSPHLLALSHVWQAPGQENRYLIAAKGSPEAILDLCHLSQPVREELLKQVAAMAGDGLRVLGVARAYFQRDTSLPPDQHDFQFEFVGFVGLADPIRANVAAAIKECYAAGIRVVMITGDYPATAQYIARQIGLRSAEHYLTGHDLETMPEEKLRERIKTVNIFARVVPEQKLLLVRALKANGEVVTMTGDGVNDAPALKAAHIGVAMGKRGTDVAREAAALVLLDDNFTSIVQAARLGRRIYENIRKALTYVLAIHVPIAGISLLPLLFGWPLVLMPVHIVFLELIIDPASSIVFEAEPEAPDLMQRPPRDPAQPLFGMRAILISLLQGLSILAVVLVVLLTGMARGLNEQSVRALSFATLVIGNLGLILVNRSHSRLIVETVRAHNAAFWWIIGGTIALLGFVLYLPPLRDLFGFALLYPLDLALGLGAGIASLLWFELFKAVSRLSRGKSHHDRPLENRSRNHAAS